MNVQRQPRLRDFHRQPAPDRQLLGRRIGLQREHRIVQRRVHALAEQHVVDVAVALEQLHLADLLDGRLNLLGVAGRGAADAEHPHRQTVLRLPFLEDLEHVGVAPGDAERGQAGAVHVLHELQAAGLELLRRDLRQPRRHGPRRRDITLDDARRPSGRIAQDRSLHEVFRVGCVRLDAEFLQRTAVQEHLVVGLLQRNRVLGRDLVQFVAREWLGIVGELLVRPAADVEHPASGAHGLRTRANQVGRLLSRLDAVEPQLFGPRRGAAQQVHVIVDEAGRDRPARQIDPSRSRARELADLRVAADGDDAIAADRDGLGDREPLVNGDDLSVRQDEVGRCLLRARQRSGEHEQRTGHREQSALSHTLVPSPWLLVLGPSRHDSE